MSAPAPNGVSPPVDPTPSCAQRQPGSHGAWHLERQRGKLYGRAKGKRLNAIQRQLLDTARADYELSSATLKADLARLLEAHSSTTHNSVVVELGFGGAEHLHHLVKLYPEGLILGVEPFLNGFAKALELLVPEGRANVKLYDGDGRDMLAALAPASVDALYALYPDPWPKRRQKKRRLLDATTLKAIARVVKPSGKFYFASDWDDYVGQVLAAILQNPDFSWDAEASEDWIAPWQHYPPRPATRYEAKALREGRVPCYFCFTRRASIQISRETK